MMMILTIIIIISSELESSGCINETSPYVSDLILRYVLILIQSSRFWYCSSIIPLAHPVLFSFWFPYSYIESRSRLTHFTKRRPDQPILCDFIILTIPGGEYEACWFKFWISVIAIPHWIYLLWVKDSPKNLTFNFWE